MVTQDLPDRQAHEDRRESASDQPPPVLPHGSIYSDEEVRLLGPWQALRQRWLTPVAAMLARGRISANVLSYISVALGLGFCLLAPWHYELAFWLLAASVLCDGLDGVQARFTHTNTARGSFTDLGCDATVVALCAAGLAWKGLIHPALAILFVYTYTALALALLLHRLLRVSSRGILRPSRMLFFAVVALEFFTHMNLLNALLLLYLLAIPLLVVSFRRLRKAL